MIKSNMIYRLILIECKLKGKLFLLITAASFSFLLLYFFSTDSNILALIDQISNFATTPSNSNFSNSTQKFHLIWFPKIFLICCTILTSMAFTEFKDEKSAQFFLSLPAQKSEKWLAKFLLYLILMPIVLVIIYQFFALATYSWDEYQVKLKLLDPFLWKHYKIIMLIQCVIFGTSVYFKNHTLYKTILLATAFYIAYNIIQLVSFLILRDDISLVNSRGIPGLNTLSGLIDQAGYQISTEADMAAISFSIMELSYLFPIAIIFLILSYLLFTELES